MKNKYVKDLMIPLDGYATIHKEGTLHDAVSVLEEAQKELPKDLEPHRAVLVIDDNKNIIGKIGHLAFIKALEPTYKLVMDKEKLFKAGVSNEFIQSMMDNLMLWQDNLADICKQARTIKVKDVMHPVTENIEEDALLVEAIQKIAKWQTLSLLVTSGSKVVGILRLSDLYKEIVRYVKEGNEDSK